MNMALNDMPFNVFDVVLVVVLGIGIARGRKHGMSEELFNLLKWLTVLLTCSLVYRPVGEWLASSSPFTLLSSYLFVYVGTALLILGIFALFKHQLGDKLVGSDFFGRSEYYLGMGSGLVRFSCVLLTFLALLNARLFTRGEVRDEEAFQNEVYGSHYFPTLHTIQATVFEQSLSGVWIKNHLGFFLIEPTKPQNKQFHQKEAQFPH